ncbi:MAG: riboflavin synthase [Bacteroidota bacterium]|nr:riboflavin synthase [Bacteroidota bacterium]
MFTGIIESTARIAAIRSHGTNKTYQMEAALAADLRPDQSVSHNGVCLTVETVNPPFYTVTAVEETLQKTNMADWQENDTVNLERCLQTGARLDGHFVQGHVDGTGLVIRKTDNKGSWLFTIAYDKAFAPLVIEKGSIAVNGISLTAFNVGLDRFDVAIIPYTYEHTNLQFVADGQRVNLEFDLLGKYLVRWAETSQKGNL